MYKNIRKPYKSTFNVLELKIQYFERCNWSFLNEENCIIKSSGLKQIAWREKMMVAIKGC